MYHPTVIERAVEKYESSTKQKLVRIPKEKCWEWSERLKQNWDEEKGEWRTPPTKEDQLFMRNELVLTALDFLYWAERYATIQKDGGGICKFSTWESQRMLLDKLAQLELKAHEAVQLGQVADGILLTLHKARQLGATAVCRCLQMHRMTKQKHRRGMSASVDDDKIMELYDRDKLIYDNLPHWQKPSFLYDEKGAHIYFDGLESRMLYQVSTQKTGLGTGRQFDQFHLTECSTWDNPDRIELDFFPTIPISPSVIGVLESTAFGRGNWWHTFTESVRKGEQPRWAYLFVPWYSEANKWRAQPPADWVPNQVSLLHAQKCSDTSTEFLGRRVMLTREQLYWWESSRQAMMNQGKLNYFLTNWCATPEESFQHSGQAPFDPGLIEDLRLHASVGRPYEIEYSPRMEA